MKVLPAAALDLTHTRLHKNNHAASTAGLDLLSALADNRLWQSTLIITEVMIKAEHHGQEISGKSSN